MRSLRPLLLFFIIVPLAEAETRVFVSLAGSLLEAEIAAVAGDNVTLKRTSDAQTLVVSRRTLCKEDNAYIATWQERRPEHSPAPAPASAPAPTPAAGSPAAPAYKYRLGCQTQPAKSNRGPPDSDHRIFEHTYTFILSNQEVVRNLENARGLVLVLGKTVGDPNGDLIVLQKEEFDVNIRAQSKMTHATQPMRLTYSQDPDLPYGVKNYGYVLIIRDAAGSVLHVEAGPESSARFIKEILSITQVPCIVDREFKLKPRSEVPLSYISF